MCNLKLSEVLYHASTKHEQAKGSIGDREEEEEEEVRPCELQLRPAFVQNIGMCNEKPLCIRRKIGTLPRLPRAPNEVTHMFQTLCFSHVHLVMLFCQISDEGAVIMQCLQIIHKGVSTLMQNIKSAAAPVPPPPPDTTISYISKLVS